MSSNDDDNLIPPDVSARNPTVSRVWNKFLHHGSNIDHDEELAEEVLSVLPDMSRLAQICRDVLTRSVRTLAADYGVDQFLDLGCGIPTDLNTHEIAQGINPEARVVYVDHDATAVLHYRTQVAENERAHAFLADAADVDGVLARAAELLDFTRPVGLLLIALMHLIPDELDPAGIVAGYRDATAPGSFLVLTHGTADHRPDVNTVASQYGRHHEVVVPRSYEQVLPLFDGYALLDPGLVFTSRWRPDPGDDLSDAETCASYTGVGRKLP